MPPRCWGELSVKAKESFHFVLSYDGGAIVLNDRNKLRPVVCAKSGSTYYASSEECSIRLLSDDIDEIWSPRGGEPVIVDIDPDESGEARQ